MSLEDTLIDLQRQIRTLQNQMNELKAKEHRHTYLDQNFYLAGDIFPRGDTDLGLSSRLNAAQVWTSHFTATDFVPSQWSWGFGAPSALGWSASTINWPFSDPSGGSTFLYRNSGGPYQYLVAKVAMQTSVVGASMGVRWDDGSDNNSVECVFECTSAQMAKTRIRYRQGGSPPAFGPDGWTDLHLSDSFIIRAQAEGTLWSSWGVRQIGLGELGNACWLPSLADIPVTMTWTPTRCGLVTRTNGNTTSWYSFYFDAILLA